MEMQPRLHTGTGACQDLLKVKSRATRARKSRGRFGAPGRWGCSLVQKQGKLNRLESTAKRNEAKYSDNSHVMVRRVQKVMAVANAATWLTMRKTEGAFHWSFARETPALYNAL